MTTHDVNGREYAKLSDLDMGDVIEADGGFTCIREGERLNVQRWLADGSLYVACASGTHNLDGQLYYEDHDSLIGFYKVER